MTSTESHADGVLGAEEAQAASAAGCPVAHPDAVAMFGPRFRHEDRRRLYRELREEHGAVAPVTLLDGIPAWLVLGYRELQQVATSPEVYSPDSTLWNQWPMIPEEWPLNPMVAREDSLHSEFGDRYVRRARILTDALGAITPVELRNFTEQAADQLIDAFCTRGTADLISEYAQQLPTMVLGRLFGLTPEEIGPIVDGINALVGSGPDAMEGRRTVLKAMEGLLALRTEQPRNDVATRYREHPNSKEFTDEGLIEDMMVTMVAGHQPTCDWIGNSMRLMMVDDWFSASLTGGRRSIAEAMNEVLWEDPPTQSVPSYYAVRDAQLAGRHIAAGDMLVLSYAGANADPQIRPDSARMTGHNSAYMSFGHGLHACPYPAQEMAREIAHTGLEVLLDRLPDTDLAVEHSQLVWRPTPIVRGLQTLPVSFTPSSPLAG